MGLREQFSEPAIQATLAQDCATLMGTIVAAKKGVGGLALKAAYGALNSISPKYIQRAIEGLIPPTLKALDPMWTEGLATGNPVEHVNTHQNQAAEVVLGVTDTRIKGAQNKLVIATYNKLRQSVKGDVAAAMPGVAEIIAKHSNTAS